MASYDARVSRDSGKGCRHIGGMGGMGNGRSCPRAKQISGVRSGEVRASSVAASGGRLGLLVNEPRVGDRDEVELRVEAVSMVAAIPASVRVQSRASWVKRLPRLDPGGRGAL